MNNKKFLVIDAEVLPEVFIKVQEAKELISNNTVKNISDAVKKVGISRSSYYKYCESVFSFDEFLSEGSISIGLRLNHKSGVLSNTLVLFASNNANVLTIKQDPPSGGSAKVVVTFEIEGGKSNLDNLLNVLSNDDNVLEILSLKK